MGQSYIMPSAGQSGAPSPIYSGTGDAILTPTAAPQKSKKSLIIILVLAALVVIAIAVSLAFSKISSSNLTSTPGTFNNFNRFTNYLTYGEDSTEQVPEDDMLTLHNKATAMYGSKDAETMQNYFNVANELLLASQDELVALENQRKKEAQQGLEEQNGEVVEENQVTMRESLNSNFATVVQFSALPYFTVLDLVSLYLDGTNISQYVGSFFNSAKSDNTAVNQYIAKQQEVLVSAQQLTQLYASNNCIQNGAILEQCLSGDIAASAQSIMEAISVAEDESYQIRQQPMENALYASQNIYLDIYAADEESEEESNVEE